MYEMLGLPEEALIQYDELDALFTQFAVNHIMGGRQHIRNEYGTCNAMKDVQ